MKNPLIKVGDPCQNEDGVVGAFLGEGKSCKYGVFHIKKGNGYILEVEEAFETSKLPSNKITPEEILTAKKTIEPLLKTPTKSPVQTKTTQAPVATPVRKNTTPKEISNLEFLAGWEEEWT